MKLIFATILILASGLAQEKPQAPQPKPGEAKTAIPAPKSVPMTVEQQKTFQLFNERSVRLQQEERSVQAETKLLQEEAQKYFDDACKAAGGSVCQPNTTASDSKDWTIRVLTPLEKK